MQTVKLSDLHPCSYINYNGEIISKEEAETMIAGGQNPVLYTVSDEWIEESLMDASNELKNGEPNFETYSAPDVHAKRILY